MAETVLHDLAARNLFDLHDVVAVVTGGASGIGLMISTTLLANGAKAVYVVGLKLAEMERITKVYNDAAQASGKPGRLYPLEGDVRHKSEATRLAEEIGKREPHVTVLFNNAGTLSGQHKRPAEPSAAAFRKAYLDDVPEDAFARDFGVNAVGPYWLTFAFLPLLERWKASPGGARLAPQVVLTTSMNGWTKDAATAGFSFPYMFSKFAAGHATAALAHELLPLGVRVNAIAPGLMPSALTAPGTAGPDGMARFATPPIPTMAVPMARPTAPNVQPAGTYRDIGTVVLCIVANWFMDGETILVDGGSFLKHASSY